MTTNATAPSICSPRSTSPPAKHRPEPVSVTPEPTFQRFSRRPTATLPVISMFTSSQMTSRLTSPDRGASGSHTPTANAGVFTSPHQFQLDEPHTGMVLDPDPSKPSKTAPSPRSHPGRGPRERHLRLDSTPEPQPAAVALDQTRLDITAWTSTPPTLIPKSSKIRRSTSPR